MADIAPSSAAPPPALLQELGFQAEHMHALAAHPRAFFEPSVATKIKLCVAFWVGKGMQRADLPAFISGNPRVSGTP